VNPIARRPAIVGGPDDPNVGEAIADHPAGQ
jgi:hypothetical protein